MIVVSCIQLLSRILSCQVAVIYYPGNYPGYRGSAGNKVDKKEDFQRKTDRVQHIFDVKTGIEFPLSD